MNMITQKQQNSIWLHLTPVVIWVIKTTSCQLNFSGHLPISVTVTKALMSYPPFDCLNRFFLLITRKRERKTRPIHVHSQLLSKWLYLIGLKQTEWMNSLLFSIDCNFETQGSAFRGESVNTSSDLGRLAYFFLKGEIL